MNSKESIQGKVFKRRCSEDKVGKYVIDANQRPLYKVDSLNN
jgi:hypothetical protein